MRFMVIVHADNNSEAGVMPSQQLLTDMGRYNEELVKAGIMQAGEGLQPTSKGARVRFTGKAPQVKQGPFPLADRPIAGFWVWKCASLQEAIAWAKRCPMEDGAELEIRQIFEAEDFGAEFTPELREQEERLRQQVEAQKKKG